jgi:hypothetical protein
MKKKAVTRKRVVSGWVCAAALAALVQATPAIAQYSGEMVLWRVDSGMDPDGSPPWLVASYDQTGSDTVTLTLTSLLRATDALWGLEEPSAAVGWAFYLNQPLSGISCRSGTCGNSNSGFNASGFDTGPVGGLFNLGFGWDRFQPFAAEDSAVYDLTFASALVWFPFDVGPGTDLFSVAQVQGIGPAGDSSWIVAAPLPIPEPEEFGLFGLGVLIALAGHCAAARMRAAPDDPIEQDPVSLPGE